MEICAIEMLIVIVFLIFSQQLSYQSRSHDAVYIVFSSVVYLNLLATQQQPMSVSRLARHKVGYSSSFFISVRGGGGGGGGGGQLPSEKLGKSSWAKR
jgi:hypothetical protein